MVFSDLDNTIIFSHRHDIEKGVPVEMYYGRRQSFMMPDGYTALQSFPASSFVPITSRTEEQYDRITFYTDGRKPHYALIDNGAYLLIDGHSDKEWFDETIKLYGDAIKDLELFARLHDDSALIKREDGVKLFFKAGNIPVLYKAAAEAGFDTYESAGKLYACPRGMTKGTAIRRFRQRFSVDEVICAGDSVSDCSMIEEADTIYLDRSLKDSLGNEERIKLVDPLKTAEIIFNTGRRI